MSPATREEPAEGSYAPGWHEGPRDRSDLARTRAPEGVARMFDGIARRYDRINDLMTMGRHRAWKRLLVGALDLREDSVVLDLCSGTGDIALLEAVAVGPRGRVTGLDFSEGMLAIARTRAPGGTVSWMQGDATALPFADASHDAASVGFGLRNVADLDTALREAFRVLRPGGRFASLDLGKPDNLLLRLGTRVHESWIAPMLAFLAGGSWSAYSYLPRSNRHFPDQRALAERFRAAGFAEVRVRDLGLGAVALVTGTKPVPGPSA